MFNCRLVLGTVISFTCNYFFENSGLSGVVTLNSLGGVFPRWFSPFISKSLVSNLFSAAFNLVGDFFMLPRLLHVIESN